MWSVGRKAAWLWRNCLEGTSRPARDPEQARRSQSSPAEGTPRGSHVARPGWGAGTRSRNTCPQRGLPASHLLPRLTRVLTVQASPPSSPCAPALLPRAPSGPLQSQARVAAGPGGTPGPSPPAPPPALVRMEDPAPRGQRRESRARREKHVLL